MNVRKLGLILSWVAGLAGCSVDPYRGPTPAPPDRITIVERGAGKEVHTPVTGCVPLRDGGESAAPNYSGYIPPVTGDR